MKRMKIMICSSMSFASEIVAMKKKLESEGHKAFIPYDTDDVVKNPMLTKDLDADLKHCIEKDVMKKCFDLLAKSDAILVLNYTKHDTPGYIGTSVLMEIGLAHHLGKKIFILNPLPDYHEERWAHEVHIMQPIILNGDLRKIK